MKAFYQISYSGPDADNYGELPDPVTSKGMLLIEVKAASINPVDYKAKRGDLKILTGSKFPKVFGSDFAGIVKETDSEEGGFNVGDRVYGAVSAFSGKPGSLSELISIEPKKVRHITGEMSFEQAASLPIAALTALNGLRRCNINAGSRLLINGATGGVGHFAVQIAKAKGAYVTATCSNANSELARRLGADETRGYSRNDHKLTEEQYDAVFDAYGKMKQEDIIRLLKPRGIYASPLLMPWSFFTSFFFKLIYGRKMTSSNMRGLPEDYEELEKLFHEKKLNPIIENIFTLEKATEAFAFAEKGKPRGKIIVKI
jgi:NADPH:quinone reductase-like Zn-dependent oxidoreductase